MAGPISLGAVEPAGLIGREARRNWMIVIAARLRAGCCRPVMGWPAASFRPDDRPRPHRIEGSDPPAAFGTAPG